MIEGAAFGMIICPLCGTSLTTTPQPSLVRLIGDPVNRIEVEYWSDMIEHACKEAKK